MKLLFVVLALALLAFSFGCTQPEGNADAQVDAPKGDTTSDAPAAIEPIDRESKLPTDIAKVLPETDVSPPKSLSAEYEDPVPMPYPISTSGAEDSPFMLSDGSAFYFFFTPDVRVPAEKQLFDGVTGIYVSKKAGSVWGKPERIVLQDAGKLALDGCEFVFGNKMWFCSAREGYEGINWFTADYAGGKWGSWQDAGFDPSYEVGELHMSRDGSELYFHSSRTGGKGGLDIWVSKKVGGEWQEPENIEAVNTADSEGWPALSPAEDELWISKNYAVWRSKKVGGEWQAPEQMFSPLAGEATIDNEGNVYFTHHFYKDNEMIEADIYVARKK